MQPLIFSPKFIFEKMLHLPFNRFQVCYVQQFTGKTKRTVYDWFSKGKMGKTSEYRDLMRNLSENKECLWCPVNSREFIKIVKDPTWGDFAASWLSNKDNDFRLTMTHLLHNQSQNINHNGWEGDLHKLGSCLPFEVLSRINDDLGKRGLSRDQIENVTEVLAFIMILVHLESEYCESMRMDSLFLGRLLPDYINHKKRLVSLPAELFMERLPDSLIERGIFQDRTHFAEYIGKGTTLYRDHVFRYINRYRAGEAVPLWATFNNFVRVIEDRFFKLQDSRNGDEVTSEEIKKRKDGMTLYLQNLFGGVLLLDGAFRFSHEALVKASLEPVSFFREEYFVCAKRMKNRGAAKPPPCD